jgi:hypothetical protein
MTPFWGRLLQRPDTVRMFETDDELSAPDKYISLFVGMGHGSVAFVEVSEHELGPWKLWRVECIAKGRLATTLLTARCSQAEALAELARQERVN